MAKEINLEGTGKHNGHAYVDLGLPSGLKWATCNVGASKPEDCGDYFQWGETKGSDTYADNQATLPYGADAATASWGKGWRMPTKDEMQDLIDNCTSECVTINEVEGRLFIGPNGNSVFLPSASCHYYGELDFAGSEGFYWSSSLYTDNPGSAWYLNFYSGNCRMNDYGRLFGLSVRPVCTK